MYYFSNFCGMSQHIGKMMELGALCTISLHCFQDLLSKHLKWQRWQNSTFKQKNVTLSKKVLVEKEGSYEELVDELITELQTFSAHLFVARWQHRQFIILKDQRNEDTLLTVSDFAENHRLVNQDEIASAYYNYKQATVYPVMCYYHLDGKMCQEAVVVISDDINHDAIAAHLFNNAVEEHLKKKGVTWSRVVSFSDGCSSQFKSRTPFHFLETNEVPQERAYFGSRHGKSPCDGIGGTVKKAASDFVRTRRGLIRDAQEFFDFANQNICTDHRSFVYIPSNEVEAARQVKLTAKTVKGTMKLHSIKNAPQGLLKRNLSCFCDGCLSEDTEANCSNEAHVDKWMSVATAKGKKRGNIKPADGPPKKSAKTENGNAANKPSKISAVKTSIAPKSQSTSFPMTLCQIRQTKCSVNRSKTKSTCERLLSQLPPIIPLADLSVCGIGKSVDEDAQELMPDGIPGEHKFPVEILPDGNCLPRCGSVLCFASEEHHREIRLRITMDLIINRELYLNDEYLSRGLPPGQSIRAVNIAQFSEFYMGDNTNEGVMYVYDQEVTHAMRCGTFMGLWQLFALANVLQTVIYSVYPNRGNPSIQKDLNRVILPKSTSSSSGPTSVFIMWTSTRKDMFRGHWIPNHFVVLLPWELGNR